MFTELHYQIVQLAANGTPVTVGEGVLDTRRPQQLPEQCVAGNFTNTSFSDLLLYDQQASQATVYQTNGNGAFAPVAHSNLGEQWDIVISNQFSNDHIDDLFCYNNQGNGGFGEIWTKIGGNNPQRLRRDRDNIAWDIIISGLFLGDGNADLILYNRETGLQKIWTTHGSAEMTTRAATYTWARNWDMILPGDFRGGLGYTDLLFYRRSATPQQRANQAEFYASDGNGNIELLWKENFQRTWDIIVPGFFNGNMSSDLFFYSRQRNEAEFWSTSGTASQRLNDIHFISNVDSSNHKWQFAVPGNFSNSFGDRTELLLIGTKQ